MKLQNVVLLSAAGMLLSGSAVWFVAPAHSRDAQAGPVTAETASPPGETPETPPESGATFTAGKTLVVEGRLGHARIPTGSTKTTYLMLEIRADKAGAKSEAENHLAIVIDRSGSMKNGRLDNAIAAAVAAVDRLGEGDRVSVVAFDTTTSIIVPMTPVDALTSGTIKNRIRGITLGGDTCISCGMGEGLAELDKSTGVADRMIVLSDGDATAGIRDVPSFEVLARQARERGAPVSTIGVGTTYNQKILGAIALHSGGGHYFVEDATSLDRIFTAEADKLRKTVALGATATIELPEGVVAERVFDRAFTRRDRKIVVPLGNFSANDTKTVLVELRVPAGAEGVLPVADVTLNYDDRSEAGGEGRCSGKLATFVTTDPSGASALDAFVAARLARSKTASVLLEANELLEQGRAEDAQEKLAEHEKALADAETQAKNAEPSPTQEAAKKDFQAQAASISGAREELGKKGGAGRAVRRNVEVANPYMQ
jgi:Ca-activated chloride channel homolog